MAYQSSTLVSGPSSATGASRPVPIQQGLVRWFLVEMGRHVADQQGFCKRVQKALSCPGWRLERKLQAL